MGRKIVGVRSPKSKVFGIRLSLPQIKLILKMLSSTVDGNITNWEGYELDSADALEHKLKLLYISVTGDEWQIQSSSQEKS